MRLKIVTFALIISSLASIARADGNTCREAIASAVCEVAPSQKGQDPQQRPCLPGSASYAPYLEALYDRLPGHLQRMFCHLKRIHIEQSLGSAAYSDLYYEPSDPTKISGGIIGLRKTLFDIWAPLDDFATWKDQTNFGVPSRRLSIHEDLPRVHSSLTNGMLDTLYFIVVHEFGHLLDFANTIVDFSAPHCQPTAGSFGSISWKSIFAPLPHSNFPLRQRLCFYDCEDKHLPAAIQDELYRSLAETTFLSLYSATSPAEDFAETFAFYTIFTERNARYQIRTASGQIFDARSLFASPALAAKRRLIERFLHAPFKYPGEKGTPYIPRISTVICD